MSTSKREANTGCQRPHLTVLGALWTLPNTLIGYLFALGSFSLPRRSNGILHAHSNRGLAYLILARRNFSAITFGNVVISVVPLDPGLRMHEEHHVRQYGVLGPFFLPAYLFLAAVYGYRKHPMERAAEACREKFCTEPVDD